MPDTPLHAILAALLLLGACRESSHCHVLHDVDGTVLPATMFSYAGDKQSQVLWATLRWRDDGRIEHRFRYRSLNADGTADTLERATDVYLVEEDERQLRLSRFAPRSLHSPDSVRVTDTLARDGQDLLWPRVLRLGEGLPTGTLVTRILRFTRGSRTERTEAPELR